MKIALQLEPHLTKGENVADSVTADVGYILYN